MADNFSANHVQGVFGKFVAVFDETVATSADNVQGVFGIFQVVLDEAAGAAAPTFQTRTTTGAAYSAGGGMYF